MMRDERGNEAELLRYVNALRRRVVQSERAELTRETEDVKESDQIFRAIFDNAADGILLVDVESKKLTMGNRVICQMLGYGQHELKTLKVVDIHREEDLPYVIEQFEKQIEGELTLARDIPVKRKDGSIFYADVNAFPITLGPKTYLIGIFRDITERKKAEEDLKQSEQKWRSLAENAPDVIFAVDLDGRILFLNRAVDPLTPETVTGTSLYDYIPSEHHNTMRNAIQHVVRTGQPYAYELAGAGPGGRVSWYQSRIGPVMCDDQVIGLTIIARDVTDQKAMEDELRKFKTIADKGGYGVAMSDLEGNLTYVNEPFAQIHGYRVGELIGKNLSILHSEEEMESVDRLARQLIETGSFVSEEVWHARGGSTKFCALMNGTLIRDEQGEPQFLACTAVDITERKKAEEALDRSEKKWYSLLKNAPDFILNLDREGTILFINHTAPGYTMEDTIGRTVYDFLPPEEHEKTREVIHDVFETGRQVKFETCVIGSDGRLLWYLNHVGPIKDGDTVVSVAQVSTDITESKRTQAMLQTKNAAIASSINGIAISDAEGDLTYVNKSFLEMWGYGDESEVLGRSAVAFWQEQDQALAVIEALRDKGGWIGELTAMRKDGSAIDVQVCGTSVTDENDRPISIMASFVDVTESKEREKELATYREHMARAEQLASLGTLSATIAHQVTQPLTVIRLSLDNVLDELEGTSCSSTVLRRLRDSVAQVSHITSIINRFRSFARQSSDTVFGEVCVHAVAARVARLLAESARQARVTLRVEDMGKLPSVFLNERELEQILFALIENAIQAADGKEAREVIIGMAAKDEQIEITFSDNCGGIAPENLEKVFEPFFTTKPRGQGTGLGLCIVQDAVARVGGHVRLESEFGKGSTFFVVLPINGD